MATESRARRLAATFDDPRSEAWAVLADELQARGDPRGELIGIEQRLESQPSEPEREALERRHEELSTMHGERWLGPQLDALRASLTRGGGWLQVNTRYGHLHSLWIRLREDEACDELADLLDSEAARYLQRLKIHAPPEATSTLAAALARSPRALVELQLDLVAVGSAKASTIREDDAARLCRALPELRALSLVGRELFEDFPHPTLEHLRVFGHDAIVGLGLWTELPRLRELELALLSGSLDERIAGRQDPSLARITELLRADGLPALRRLDLSHNAAGCRPDSIYLGGRRAGELLEQLLDAPVLERLDALALPPPDPGVVERLFASARLARVGDIHVPFARFELDEAARAAALPQLRVGLVYPHRPVSEIHGREVMAVEIGDDGGIWIGMVALAEIMEARYASLSPALRSALDEIIDRFDELAYYEDEGGPTQVDIDYAMFDETFTQLCEGFDLVGSRIGGLLEALAEHRGTVDVVRLEKVWGW